MLIFQDHIRVIEDLTEYGTIKGLNGLLGVTLVLMILVVAFAIYGLFIAINIDIEMKKASDMLLDCKSVANRSTLDLRNGLIKIDDLKSNFDDITDEWERYLVTLKSRL